MRSLLIPLFILLRLKSLIQSANGRDADERQNFLFADDPDAQDIIQEYQINLGDIDSYYESLGDKPQETEVHRIPSFLTSNYEFDRVVNFYSPWCAHCQKFKPRYIDLAERFSTSTNKDLQKIEFHTVSCSAHHWLCKASSIQGYPIVRIYKRGSVDFQEAKRFTPQAIAAVFGIQLDKIYSEQKGEFQDVELRQYNQDVYDVLGAAMDAYRRTKKDVFHDATVSLLFALQFDVNVENSDTGPSRDTRIAAFSTWIDLLYWTLPSSWKVNTLINDIRVNNNFNFLTNDAIAQAVENNKEVVLPDPSALWTNSCQRRSRKSEGYTCGLWSLLHIMSIGVAEQHHAVIGDTETVRTEHVVEAMHDYINNFLGCKICKTNFNKLYKKSCGKHGNGCDRFKKDKYKGKRIDPRKNPNLEYWRDLSLWVWELHNSINLEVLKERKAADGQEANGADIEHVIYPSAKACPNCKTRSGQWDKNEVYNYLKSQYWPEGVHNFRYVVLKSKKEDLKVRKPRNVVNETTWQTLGILVSILIIVSSQYYKKQKKVAKKKKKRSKDDAKPKERSVRSSIRLRSKRFS
jgi:thiol-disulfide isomerase/thioredoxin